MVQEALKVIVFSGFVTLASFNMFTVTAGEMEGKEKAAAEEMKSKEKAAAEKMEGKEKAAAEEVEDKGKKDTSGLKMPPIEFAAGVEKGKLKNPYTDNAEAIKEGKELYFSYSCNGCHGGTGGGGMCPPLSNEVWIYGSDDDVLFRLIAEGSDKLLGAGYKRVRSEKVKGPMPPFGELIENADELWKILAWVRTTYRGDPKRRDW